MKVIVRYQHIFVILALHSEVYTQDNLTVTVTVNTVMCFTHKSRM